MITRANLSLQMLGRWGSGYHSIMQTRTRCVSASAPGKVILHGEHSVVYGKLALAAAIGLRTTVKIDDGYADGFSIDLPDIGKNFKIPRDRLRRMREGYDGPVHELDQSLLSRIRQEEDGDNNGLAAAIYLYLTQPGAELCPGLSVTVTSKIPVGAGLGSSAAYSVALAAALSKAFYSSGKAQGGADGDPLTALPKKKRKTSRTDNNNLLVDDGDISAPISVYSLDGKEDGQYEAERRSAAGKEKELSSSEQSLICRRAFLAEKILHGNPSGETKQRDRGGR